MELGYGVSSSVLDLGVVGLTASGGHGLGSARFRHEAVAAVFRADPDAGLCVLGVQQDKWPFDQLWSVPSVPMKLDETLECALFRYLNCEMSIDNLAHLEQLQTCSDLSGDLTDRRVTTAYLGVIAWSVDPLLPDHAAWLRLDDLPKMTFDHARIVEQAAARLRAKMCYTNIGYALAPEKFTISQLRNAYVSVLGYDVSATNLQRVLQRRGQLEATGELAPSGAEGGRPARLYRFSSRRLVVTDPFATLRP